MDQNDARRLEILRNGVQKAPAQFVSILSDDVRWLIELATANAEARDGGVQQHKPPERLET